MQDNASVDTTKKNLESLERSKYDLLDQRPQSPDLNHLGNIWSAIEQALLDISLPSNANANNLLEKIEQIWNNYPTDELLKYIKSMPSRIEEVIQAKG